MNVHPEVMSEPQRAVLQRLGPLVPAKKFYLGGGTAVALHLGHRRSADLDWFAGEPFGDPLRLAADLRDHGLEVAVTGTDAGTLHATIEGVQTTFLEYRYPLLEEPVELPEHGCRLAALEDLACTKLSAIAGRGARRDFIDLWAIFRSGMTLHRALQRYTEKYGVADVAHLLRSLVYFDDAATEAMPVMLWVVSWDEIRQAFEDWVKEAVRQT